MTTLHIVRKSAYSSHDFEQCLSVLGDQDAIVFIDDGCYNLTHPLLHNLITQQSDTVAISVIASHAQARAIKTDNIAAISPIDMVDVVTLTFNHNKVITWQ